MTSYYVTIRTDLLGEQKAVPSGKTKQENGTVYAEMIPIEKGYYKDKFWVTRDMLV